MSVDSFSDDADALAAQLTQPLVFVDLETTGGDASQDRITEIGVLEVGPSGIEQWSTLVDPQQPIPPFIQQLTGIADHMVSGQPTFAALAAGLAERLAGKLFIAHNARFDYGFLKNEFARVGMRFRADVLCTVRLSRALFPSVQRHGLDALITRFGLQPLGRHRALADAELLWQFWQKIHSLYSAELIDAAVKKLIRRASLPPALPEDALRDVPASAGVYIFHGTGAVPLYIGKSVNLKQRVGAHFSSDHRSAKDLALSAAIRRIEIRPTAGEIGALLLEAELVKTLAPSHNAQLRKRAGLCSWHLPTGAAAPLLVFAEHLDIGRGRDLFGAFGSRARAQAWLRSLADEHRLCQRLLGVEGSPAGRPCFGYQVGHCDGACVDDEAASLHAAEHVARLATAIESKRLKPWPYAGPIAIVERAATADATPAVEWHVIDNWCYLGSTADACGAAALLDGATQVPLFEQDVYAILASRLGRQPPDIIELAATPVFRLLPPPATPASAAARRRPRALDARPPEATSDAATRQARPIRRYANAADGQLGFEFG